MTRSVVATCLASLLQLVSSDVSGQTFTYERSGGCANVLLYGSNRSRTESIVVLADREVLGLAIGTTTLSLADTPKGLEVRIDLFAAPLPDVNYCTDLAVRGQDTPTSTMRADAGQVTITLGERGAVKGAAPFMYQAKVVLRDLSFKKPDGSIAFERGPIVLSAVVGYTYG